MKSTQLTVRILLFFFGMTVSASLMAQQRNALDSKKHRDTVLDKSGLNPQIRKGGNGSRHFLYTPDFGGMQQSPGSLLSAGKTARINSPYKVVRSKETGLPIFITTNRNAPHKMIRSANPEDKKGSCFAYLNEISAIMKVTKPEQEFAIRKIETESNGKTHIRLIQKYKGIEIYNAESIVHLDASGLGEAFNGTYHASGKIGDLNVVPSITSQEAVSKVIGDVSKKTNYRELNAKEKELLHYTGPEIEIVLYPDQSLVTTYLLSYQITVHPNMKEHWEYVIDAKNGSIIEGYKSSCHVDGPRTATANDLNGISQTINTYQEGSSYILADYSRAMFDPTDSSGLIVTLDADFTYGSNFNVQPITSATNTWNDPIAVSAHHNAGVAYEYYKNVHGRNSIDGNNGTIYSVINVPNEDGTPMDNAYWNGAYMSYGNGDVYFKPLAGSQDVAGHEMTHGVVQNSANLRYQGESGAINESMADIFGSMMDSTDWLIGEDVVEIAYFPSGCLRSLMDPHNGGTSLADPDYQPRHVSEKYTGTQDNGGVHINSGIPNWAFYKYATALGSRLEAAEIYYRALTVYLTQNSNFTDLRLAVIKAAEDLHGVGSTEATEAGLAFDAVGILDGPGGGGGTVVNTFPVNPGTEYMLSYDTDAGVPSQGLFRSSAEGTNFSLLLPKSVANKPSVTDNGQLCVYVGTDQKIHRINVAPGQLLNNTIIQNNAIWSNAAISKDGKRIAAVTLDDDTSVYIFDLTTSQVARYILYNPTFSEGVKSGGPVYADALEWDYTGEYLLYDCFNHITSTNNQDIEFWDINLIKVWDNAANDFGDGEVFKLFNNLEEGEGLGNPVFSKNSPNVIAFDYVNEITFEFGVIGMDIEQNSIGLIATNNYLGWPSFNKYDTRVAYTGADGVLNVYCVDLNADKISSSSAEMGLIGNAQWPVYYSVGSRVTGIEEERSAGTTELILFPNPTRNDLSVVLPGINKGEFTVEITNQLGQLVFSKVYANVQSETVELTTGELPSGMYSLHYRSNSFSVSRKFIKQDSGHR